MNQIPEFWRAEVWHPLSVHFPVALLLLSLVFKIVALKNKKEVWHQGGSILLFVGTVGAWISIYTGNLADGAVSRTICDPTILKDHENGAYVMAWLFSVAAVLDIIYWTGILPLKKIWIKIAVLILLFIGSGFLVQVGHLGASLVYQQGAGVYKPSPDCIEFIEHD